VVLTAISTAMVWLYTPQLSARWGLTVPHRDPSMLHHTYLYATFGGNALFGSSTWIPLRVFTTCAIPPRHGRGGRV
jgi:hypothetical protein